MSGGPALPTKVDRLTQTQLGSGQIALSTQHPAERRFVRGDILICHTKRFAVDRECPREKRIRFDVLLLKSESDSETIQAVCRLTVTLAEMRDAQCAFAVANRQCRKVLMIRFSVRVDERTRAP